MTSLRVPEYLSPSSMAIFEKNPDQFFERYLVPKNIRPEREPQSDAQATGSAFDALIKNYIHELHYGHEKTVEAKYRIRDLVTQQCEAEQLPEALSVACHLFEEYRECGALGDLVDAVRQSTTPPRMEFTVRETIGGVPLLGKPDLHYFTNLHAHVIADFKVSGSRSVHGVSPQQGFMVARDVRGSNTHGLPHKKFQPVMHPGGIIVSALPMNETTDYWADQLTTYAWCLGEPVGSQNFVVRIEQLACRPNKDGLRIKCCTHQSTVDEAYQHRLLERYQQCWQAIQDNHIWQDLSIEESQARGDIIIRTLQAPSADVLASQTSESASDIDWSF